MRDSTGARIIFPTAEDQDQELITVIGTEEAVAEAQKELEALIKSLVSPSIHLFLFLFFFSTDPQKNENLQNGNYLP